MRCSIIIPVLNEAEGITAFLAHLQALRQAGHEVIVVDGGSVDATLELARPAVDQLVETSAGRARQMNAGAKVANGDILVFLHADTFLPDTAMQDISQSLAMTRKVWGHFAVRLSGRQPLFRLIEWMMSRRSCITGIVTGDQAMFIRRDVFALSGRFDDIPLMEDIAMSKKLKAYCRPLCLRTKVCTSSRRWEQRGIVRTVFLMWSLRLRYWMGASPHALVRRYYQNSS
jgi:rSAM/selenodomain-associated transferase 2